MSPENKSETVDILGHRFYQTDIRWAVPWSFDSGFAMVNASDLEWEEWPDERSGRPCSPLWDPQASVRVATPGGSTPVAPPANQPGGVWELGRRQGHGGHGFYDTPEEAVAALREEDAEASRRITGAVLRQL